MNKNIPHLRFLQKKISYQLFEITDTNGLAHFIDTDYLKQAIFNSSIKEQQIISQTLRRLDFYNQPVIGYLKFLAEALVSQYNNPL